MKKHDLKILIVDDDPELGDILSNLCAMNGLRTKKDAALQQNRVEDVFKEEIEATIRAVLGKVLQ